MKSLKMFFIIVFVFPFTSNSFAQINTIKIGEKKEVIIPYDSLESINEKNYKSQIGQTLFLKANHSAEEVGVYSNFYLNPPFGIDKIQNAYHKSKRYNEGSDYNYMKGRYFYVNNIIVKQNGSEYSSSIGKGYFQLIEKETGDTLYYQFQMPLYPFSFKDFVTVGYFEKLKSTYIGKEFVYTYDLLSPMDPSEPFYEGFSYIRNLTDGSARTEIPKGTILKCIDISVMESFGKSLIIAVMDNDKFGKSFVWVDDIAKPNWLFNKFTPLEEYKKMLADEAARKRSLINKYGQGTAKLILDGKVQIGFTKQMCIESWGEPEDINRTTGSYGVHEQWVYGNGRYLYFDNGKLTSIQN